MCSVSFTLRMEQKVTNEDLLKKSLEMSMVTRELFLILYRPSLLLSLSLSWAVISLKGARTPPWFCVSTLTSVLVCAGLPRNTVYKRPVLWCRAQARTLMLF